MNRATIFSVILIEGFVTIAVEILSIRQMTPFVGSNILNTSIIIGVFLLFLSFGYYKGGTVNKNYSQTLLKNLLNTFLFLSFGLSYTFLSILFHFIEGLWGLLAFSLFIMAPTVYFLGQTIPILTNLIKDERNGKISGQLLFFSTFGSFLGSIITSAALLNYAGVNATVFVVIALLSLLILMLGWQTKELFIRSVVLILALMPIVAIANANYSFSKTNNYSNIAVVEDNRTNYLIINDSMSSSFSIDRKESTFDYIKVLESYIKSIDNKPKDILVLGAGGFTLSLNDKLNNYAYVDIDKDLKNVSEQELLGQPINGKFIPDDGRHFLIKNKTKYDVIVVDVYSNKTSIPASFVTDDFYASTKKSLKKDGVLLVNTISKPLFKDDYSKHLNNSILNNYHCMVSPIHDNLNEYQNILYACSPKDTNGDTIYTDNLTNLFELAHR